jgi:hypothetical protein
VNLLGRVALFDSVFSGYVHEECQRNGEFSGRPKECGHWIAEPARNDSESAVETVVCRPGELKGIARMPMMHPIGRSQRLSDHTNVAAVDCRLSGARYADQGECIAAGADFHPVPFSNSSK